MSVLQSGDSDEKCSEAEDNGEDGFKRHGIGVRLASQVEIIIKIEEYLNQKSAMKWTLSFL